MIDRKIVERKLQTKVPEDIEKLLRAPKDPFVVLEHAIFCLVNDPGIVSVIEKEHVIDTPRRVKEAYRELLSGVHQDPKSSLGTMFPANGFSEMVIIRDIEFTSVCAHHLVPFFGHVTFGYIPKDRIVGLSKIPRMIHAFSRRPQVQEKLTSQIVDMFDEVVSPAGCGVLVEAVHLCMAIRGVKVKDATTVTSALRGNFLKSQVRQEFLQLANGRK